MTAIRRGVGPADFRSPVHSLARLFHLPAVMPPKFVGRANEDRIVVLFKEGPLPLRLVTTRELS